MLLLGVREYIKTATVLTAIENHIFSKSIFCEMQLEITIKLLLKNKKEA